MDLDVRRNHAVRINGFSYPPNARPVERYFCMQASKIAATFLLTHEGEKQTGVHSFGGLFHLLASEHAAKVFPQDDVHPCSQFCEKVIPA